MLEVNNSRAKEQFHYKNAYMEVSLRVIDIFNWK